MSVLIDDAIHDLQSRLNDLQCHVDFLTQNESRLLKHLSAMVITLKKRECHDCYDIAALLIEGAIDQHAFNCEEHYKETMEAQERDRIYNQRHE
jgi:hypothetical protein